MSNSKPRALVIPPGALEDAEGAEVLRAWIANKGLHVSLAPAFDSPEPWGMMLVDIARHAARAMAAEKICTEAEALNRIRAIIDAEWEEPTDEGSTEPHRTQ